MGKEYIMLRYIIKMYVFFGAKCFFRISQDPV